MKLLFLVDNNEPHASGGGYYAIFKFAEFLAKRNHQILIYAVNDLGWVKPAGKLQIFYRPKLSRKKRISRKLDTLLERVCDKTLLPRLARRFAPDWVLGVFKESAIKAVELGKGQGCPVANFVYECPPWLREIYGEEAYQQAMNNRHTVELWNSTLQAYRESQLLLPNSILSQEFNEAWIGAGNVVAPVYPGVDSEQMPFEGPRLQEAQKSVLFVGRLVEEKNVHHLIDAWRLLPSDIVLDIVGKGPLEETLKLKAAGMPNIHFHGYVSDDTLWQLFRSTTMLVCPTRFEGFGMPPMQALYFEKPCLATDLPILRSIYGDHIDYFPVGDINKIASEVERIVNHPEYARQKGSAGRSFILANFTWQIGAERIEAELERCGK